MQRNEIVAVTVQNLAEFWNAATRPTEQNGLGFSIDEAQGEIAKLESFFEVLTESSRSYAVWKRLLLTCRIHGVQVHDARLVSVMKAQGMTQILTFDTGDFSRYTDIEVLHPDQFR